MNGLFSMNYFVGIVKIFVQHSFRNIITHGSLQELYYACRNYKLYIREIIIIVLHLQDI